MKSLIFFLFFLVIFIRAQENVNKAQKLIYLAQFYEKTDKRKAVKIYREAFSLCPELIESNMSSYINLHPDKKKPKLIKKTIHKLSYIKLFNENDLEDNKNFKIFFEQNNASKSVLLKKLIANYYSNEENYKKIAFDKELMKLNNADQYIRVLQEQVKSDCLTELRNREDSLNAIQLVELTKKYGWDRKGWWTLWHQRGKYSRKNEIWSYFIPFINDLIKKDMVRKDFFLPFELNKAMVHKEPYLYDYWLPLANRYTEADINSIDQYRKSVGLPPLYFEKFSNPNKQLPELYKYNPKNLLKDLENL